jgi:uncharacterized protein (DUF885 family)
MSRLPRFRVITQSCAAIALLLSATRPLAAQPDSTPASQSLARWLDTIANGMRTQPPRAAAARTNLQEVSEAAWRDDAVRWGRVAAALRTLPDAALSPTERVTKRTVLWEAQLQAKKAPFWWFDFSDVTPYASPLRDIAQRIRSRPLKTAADTSAYLQSLQRVVPLLDAIYDGLVRRAARGVRLAKPAIPASVALLRAYTAPGASNPFSTTPSQVQTLDSTTGAAFSVRTSALVDTRIAPAAARIVSLLEGPYAAAASDAVGLSSYPGGRAYYDWLVQWHTTLPVTAQELHDYGLAEVARIEREMADIRREVGFTGTREAFHAQLARDPRFFAKTPDEFGARLMLYAMRLKPRLDATFSKQPHAPGDVRRLAPELEPALTFGFYQPPSVTDSTGHYFFNGTGLDQRSLLTAAPLIAHELWPGHHFQISLALENSALPPFRRNRSYTAFSEGWGDYASLVAGELGLYSDPYDRYGRLAMEMFIACRLVVDTGTNAFGWSLERLRNYMRAHVLESETQILTESLRYSTDLPGQALAYKAGSREFQRLRTESAARLGAAFDIRAFHAFVLDQGSLPMSVLRARVTAWDGRMP